MSRTMTMEEYRKVERTIAKKSRELTKKEDIINFLHNVGFCDKKGAAIYPYNTSRKKK